MFITNTNERIEQMVHKHKTEESNAKVHHKYKRKNRTNGSSKKTKESKHGSSQIQTNESNKWFAPKNERIEKRFITNTNEIIEQMVHHKKTKESKHVRHEYK